MTYLFRVLLDASIRISLVAMAVGGMVYFLRIRSSSLRHKAWLVVLFAMLLMPVLPYVLPRLNISAVAPAKSTAPFEAPSQQVAEPPSPSRIVATDPPVVAGPSPARPANQEILFTALAALYVLGALILLGRLLAGWAVARRLVTSSSPISVRGVMAYECAHITTPVTVGLRAARILLPRNWREWPEDKVTAVMAHEAAHVRRRDTLSGFLAHLNRAVFWFHPLAWWLQRRLALDAEQACDDAGVFAVGEIRKYTEVLLDIAESVRRRGGTFAFHGAGVDGTGLLEPRIDRLLRGVHSVRATRVQRAALAISCGIVVFFAAACQQKTVTELKADPEYARQIADSIARSAKYQEIGQMSAADAEALEAKVHQNTDDADSRDKLMSFYQSRGRQVLGDEKATKGFWALELWCIEHHPEEPCSFLAPPLFDRASYEKGAKLWEAVLRRPGVTPNLQVSAARYFMQADPKRAEEIVTAAGIDERKRSGLLSGIYGTALLGGTSSSTPYAEDVRKRLEQSKDAAVLSMTGFMLVRSQAPHSAAGMLGQKYIERAAALDPTSVNRDELARMDRIQLSGQRYQQMMAGIENEVSEAQYQKAAALPPDRRAPIMPYLAERAYWAGALRVDYNHDSADAHVDWELARKYAKDALAVEDSFRSDPDYHNRVYKADIILAFIAVLADANDKEARQYLRAAAPIPTDDNWFPSTLKLMVLMLRYGNADDRAAVIDFCEVHGKLAPTRGVDLIQSAQRLRHGLMPTWYQYEVTQFKK